MGCCESRRPMGLRQRQTINQKQSMVDSTTTVTKSHLSKQDHQEMNEYMNSLKELYGYEKLKSIWFNSSEEIKIYQCFAIQTQKYSVSSTVIDLDATRSIGFKFAIIAPQLNELTTDNIKNLLFVYCKEQRPTQRKVVPVAIRIEKSRANKEQGNFQFTADLNGIVKLNLRIQIHQNHA